MSRWLITLSLVIILGAFAFGEAQPATYYCYAFLEGETDHSNIIVCFKGPAQTFCDTTNSSGYWSISGLTPGVSIYDVDMHPPCLGWESKHWENISVPAGTNECDSYDTLSRGLCGELIGEFCRGGDFPVKCDIWVPNGEQVRIPAYVDSVGRIRLLFKQDYTFTIHGKLKAEGDAEDSVIFTTDPATLYWGGLNFNTADSYSTLKYCVIEKGYADGVDDYNDGGCIYINNSSNIYIEHCRIQDCDAVDDGGGICFNNQSSYARVSHCEIFDNTAGDDGGGIYTNSPYPYIYDCEFNNNNAGYDGGGVYCYNFNQDIEDCEFDSNAASGYGGAIYLLNSDPDIDVCTIIRNDAYRGGGIYFSSCANPSLDSCTIANNVAAQRGGGIYCTNSSAKVDSCVINNNRANYGGGVYCYNNSYATFNNTIMIGNNATVNGGGVYCNNSNATVDGCAINNNTASDGGGAYCYNNSYATFNNTTMMGNKATVNGGGIYCTGSDPIFTFCTINNDSANYGGGMYFSYCDSPLVYDCSLSVNNAIERGGGIYCDNSNVTVDSCAINANSANDGGGVYFNECEHGNLEYCAIVNNWSQNTGGAIYCERSSPNLDHCTISDDSAETACAIYCYSDNPDQRSDIVARNTIVYFNPCEEPIVIQGYASFTGLCCDIEGGWEPDTTNIDEDPLFCDRDNGDYRLKKESPCYNHPQCGLIGALGRCCYDQNLALIWSCEADRPLPLSVPAGSSWACSVRVWSKYACDPTAIPAPVYLSVDPPNFFLASATIPTGFPGDSHDSAFVIGTFTASQAADTVQTLIADVTLPGDDYPSDNTYDDDFLFFVTDSLSEYVGYDDFRAKTGQRSWPPWEGVGVAFFPNYNWGNWKGDPPGEGYKLLSVNWQSAYAGSTRVRIYTKTKWLTVTNPPLVDTVVTIDRSRPEWSSIDFYDSLGNVPPDLDNLSEPFFVYLSWEGISADSVGGVGFDGPEILGGHTFLGKDDGDSLILTHYIDYDPDEPYQDATIRARVASRRWVPPPEEEFIRGDYNEDGQLLTVDPLIELQWLYGVPGAPPPSCKDAADYNDDGFILTNDPIMALQYIFGVPGAPPPSPPFGIPPDDCGPDPTEDNLDCASYPPCGTKGVTVAYKPSVSIDDAVNRLVVGEPTVADGVVRVPVDLTLSEVVCGFDISLGYDVSSLRFKEVVGGDSYDFYAVDTREDGVVRIGCVPDIEMADLMGAGTHRVGEILFTVEGKADVELNWRKVEVYGSTVEALSVEWVVKEGVSNLPSEFALSQNYPNPFNPTTLIKYALPVDCQVRLDVYNVIGQRVATLVDGHQKAGYKLVSWNAQDLASGVYFYRLRAGDFTSTRKMVLLK